MKLILSSLQKEQCQNRLYSSRWYSSSSTILLDTLVVALSALSIKKNYYRAGLNKMTAFLRLSHHQVIKFSCNNVSNFDYISISDYLILKKHDFHIKTFRATGILKPPKKRCLQTSFSMGICTFVQVTFWSWMS